VPLTLDTKRKTGNKYKMKNNRATYIWVRCIGW